VEKSLQGQSWPPRRSTFVPNFWKALSINPDHLEATWQKLKAIMQPGKLDLRTRRSSLSPSRSQQLRVLNPLPQRRVKRLGLDNEAIGEIVAVVDIFTATNRHRHAYQSNRT